VFGLGCFWGAERIFWQLGEASLPRRSATPAAHRQSDLRRVCRAAPAIPKWCWWCSIRRISYEALLKTFWENHNPTQGMRQGNDVGQYRSAIYTFGEAQRKATDASKAT
jgi:peptide-methionine (S)-S-oxide reductase